MTQLESQPAKKEVIKLGPGFITDGKKRLMVMTPPISAYLFGYDAIDKNLKRSLLIKMDYLSFGHLFSSTLNSLIADILNYFQNRIKIISGKEEKITSIPEGKAIFFKKMNIEIKTLIGDKGYQELKKLDEIRGKFQHSNDRYFIDYRVNGKNLNSPKELIIYSEKIRRIIIELDEKLEKTNPTYNTKIIQEQGKTTIEMQAIGHSFDLKTLQFNKGTENESK